MEIITATKKHLTGCLKLSKIPELKSALGDYPDEELLASFLHNKLFIVAVENERVIGFILGEITGKSNGAILWYLTVNKNFRGQRIGRMLIDEFERRCKTMKREWIILYASLLNRGALRFYKKANYVVGSKVIECLKLLD